MPLTILSGNPTGTFEEGQDSAYKVGNPLIYNTPAPSSSNAATTLTAQQVINGMATQSTATAAAMTFPSAPAIAAVLRQFSSRGIVPGDGIYFTAVAGGAGAVTLTVNGTNLTLDANTSTSVPAGTERSLFIRFTSGTPGSETAVIF